MGTIYLNSQEGSFHARRMTSGIAISQLPQQFISAFPSPVCPFLSFLDFGMLNIEKLYRLPRANIPRSATMSLFDQF